MKTVKLIFPQWQGGNNPDYAFGSILLQHIVPTHPSIETIQVPVDLNFNKIEMKHEIEGEQMLLQQLQAVYQILEDRQPDKVIIVGGDCAVSQAPFDYLHGKYQDTFGVLWLDAHPDVSTIKHSTRNHEMVLENLMSGKGSTIADTIKYPINDKKVMLAGLIYDELREKDKNVDKRHLHYATPHLLKENSDSILNWIKDNHIKHLAIHFDLDVLDPKDFRSIYPAEPHLANFDAAIGKLNLSDITRIVQDVSHMVTIVGFTIAEYLPWDAMRLRETLSNIPIFIENEGDEAE